MTTNQRICIYCLSLTYIVSIYSTLVHVNEYRYNQHVYLREGDGWIQQLRKPLLTEFIFIIA